MHFRETCHLGNITGLIERCTVVQKESNTAGKKVYKGMFLIHTDYKFEKLAPSQQQPRDTEVGQTGEINFWLAMVGKLRKYCRLFRFISLTGAFTIFRNVWASDRGCLITV